MKGIVFIFLFFSSPLYVNASTLENILQRKEHSEWGYFFISGIFEGGSNRSSSEKVMKLFDGKKIIFNGDLLSITDACTYKYTAELKTPLSFWKSDKTVDFYEAFFSRYKIKMPKSFLDITPINPSEKCDFPFSEFIVLDDNIVFFYEHNAIFFFKNEQMLKDHEKSSVENNGNVDGKPIESENICKEVESNADDYNSSEECFYKNMSVIDTYLEYRKKLMDYDKKYLQDKIISKENFSTKCSDGCITVTYKWDGPDNLVITQQFDGGETEISFTKEVQGCRVVTKLFPD
ncbi:hypothetical protein QNT90_002349 [Salmonella enterica]|nr:hypothetical protein [Salmonella enterica]ELV2959971.1 hypothetical protein [Salmonella enterica]